MFLMGPKGVFNSYGFWSTFIILEIIKRENSKIIQKFGYTSLFQGYLYYFLKFLRLFLGIWDVKWLQPLIGLVFQMFTRYIGHRNRYSDQFYRGRYLSIFFSRFWYLLYGLGSEVAFGIDNASDISLPFDRRRSHFVSCHISTYGRSLIRGKAELASMNADRISNSSIIFFVRTINLSKKLISLFHEEKIQILNLIQWKM